MIQLRPHRCARKAPAAMRRRTVDADTPRYAAASRTENSGLGKNSIGLLVVLCDFGMGPSPSATSVCILATPCADLRLLTVTHRITGAHLPGGIYLQIAPKLRLSRLPWSGADVNRLVRQRHPRGRGYRSSAAWSRPGGAPGIG